MSETEIEKEAPVAAQTHESKGQKKRRKARERKERTLEEQRQAEAKKIAAYPELIAKWNQEAKRLRTIHGIVQFEWPKMKTDEFNATHLTACSFSEKCKSGIVPMTNTTYAPITIATMAMTKLHDITEKNHVIIVDLPNDPVVRTGFERAIRTFDSHETLRLKEFAEASDDMGIFEQHCIPVVVVDEDGKEQTMIRTQLLHHLEQDIEKADVLDRSFVYGMLGIDDSDESVDTAPANKWLVPRKMRCEDPEDPGVENGFKTAEVVSFVDGIDLYFSSLTKSIMIVVWDRDAFPYWTFPWSQTRNPTFIVQDTWWNRSKLVTSHVSDKIDQTIRSYLELENEELEDEYAKTLTESEQNEYEVFKEMRNEIREKGTEVEKDDDGNERQLTKKTVELMSEVEEEYEDTKKVEVKDENSATRMEVQKVKRTRKVMKLVRKTLELTSSNPYGFNIGAYVYWLNENMPRVIELAKKPPLLEYPGMTVVVLLDQCSDGGRHIPTRTPIETKKATLKLLGTSSPERKSNLRNSNKAIVNKGAAGSASRTQAERNKEFKTEEENKRLAQQVEGLVDPIGDSSQLAVAKKQGQKVIANDTSGTKEWKKKELTLKDIGDELKAYRTRAQDMEQNIKKMIREKESEENTANIKKEKKRLRRLLEIIEATQIKFNRESPV